MSDPVIICVAITGSVPRRSDNPAVPITVAEQIDSTHEAFEAGAAIAHCHVRNEDETPSSDPERFARLKEGIERHCPGMIVQLSTGGRSGAGRGRGGMIGLRPDMCSLSVGSNNFPTRVYENPPDLVDWLASEMTAHGVVPEIECFDLSHLYQAHAMWPTGGCRLRRRATIPAGRPIASSFWACATRFRPSAARSSSCGPPIGTSSARCRGAPPGSGAISSS